MSCVCGVNGEGEWWVEGEEVDSGGSTVELVAQLGGVVRWEVCWMDGGGCCRRRQMFLVLKGKEEW